MSSDDEELVVRNPFAVRSSASTRTSNRRSRGNQKQDVNEALEAIKQAHKTGRVQRRDVSSLQKPVYEEVDEEEYRRIVQERQENDFVVDDDGSGYVDHGLDIFDDEDPSEAAGEPKRKKAKTEKRKKGGISDFFSATVPSKKDDNAVTLGDDPDVEALLQEVEFDNPLKENEFDEERENEAVQKAVVKNPFKRPNSPVHITPVPVKLSRAHKIKRSSIVGGETCKPEPKYEIPKVEDEDTPEYYDETFVLPEKTSTGERIAHSEAGNKIKQLPLYRSEPEAEVKTEVPPVNLVKEETVEDLDMEVDTADAVPATSEFQWDSNLVGDVENVESGTVETTTGESDFICENAEGKASLKMFWLDAYEDPIKHPGTVYVFGRVLRNGNSESCCLIVKNIWRQVYFLPRDSRSSGESGARLDVSVYNEVRSLLKQHGVSTIKCKPAEKKFAYNDGVIPKVASVLEVQYSSSGVKLPADLKGETFSHVFNTTATAMERLLLETDMKGPCWIEVSNYTDSKPPVSYAAHEYTVDMERMKSIRVLDCTDRPPTISILSLNIVSGTNAKKENEIALISCVLDRKCSLERPTTSTSLLDRFCFLAKPSSTAFPFDLEKYLAQNRLNGYVNKASNERHLLSQFLNKLQNLDPDAYLGHDMIAQFSLLVSRLEKYKLGNWSCMSRLRRTIALKQSGRSKAANWELTAGRFVLDSRSSAMELVKSRSYDLSELSETLLGRRREPLSEVASCFFSSRELVKLIKLSFDDAYLSLSVIARLNALPLFIQITQIVGGVMSRTVMGGRAERNEFLLLHAFHKNGYVAPNKYQRVFKKNETHMDDSAMQHEDVDDKTGEKSSKKAQYTGGLVLEPKKGLYDTYILLLDFNSLYPSIIQEYNICFTTVDQSKKMGNDGDLPDLPDDSEEGILPREIRVLVERRREVKKLMKDRISDQLRQQYDIRQMGLKLTANSMYGCLGFIQSRFYAKPLAALITSRGREILMHTKDLVEKQGYSVIYGDTDSIMIDTGLLDLEQVKKLGYEIKRTVNKCHKKLELDLDGVYKRLLLLKKKKYVGLAVDLATGNVKREMKGLDIVRRDWSVLAKEIGNEVVDVILSDVDRDEMVEKIHDLLSALKDRLNTGAVDISKFEILKQLTRGVEEYGDVKAQPHVSVAQRLNSTGNFHFHRGDTVAYIICEDGTSNSAVQRAYHKTEVLENKDLKLDVHYYLAQQVHPVVCRLCEPIEGTDAVRIAEALGLDGSSYRSRVQVRTEEEEQEQYSIGLQPDYTSCDAFVFRCPNEGCSKELSVRETFIGDDLNIRSWVDECPSCSHSLLSFAPHLVNQLTLSLTSFIERYYTPTYVCDDVACAYRSRRQGLKWSRDGVHCTKCSYGLMKPQYTARMLFMQQSFFRSIFDLEKAISNCKLEQQRKLKTRKDLVHLYNLHAQMLAVCDNFLKTNDFNKVSLSYLFANMNAF